jgi:hypothetical protein
MRFSEFIGYSKSYFLSPLIGGVFSNPATRWPKTLGRLQFLRVHPYFLPCAISGSIAFTTFIIAVLALKEVCRFLMILYHRIQVVLLIYVQTLPSLVAKKNTSIPDELETAVKTPLMNHRESLDYGVTTVQGRSAPSESTATNKPALFNRGLIFIYLNYASLSFLEMGYGSLLPLFYSTSIPLGGVGLDPYMIGITMGSFGGINAIVQAIFLGALIKKFGARKMYILSFPGLFACVTLYPIIRYLAQHYGRVNILVIACMIVQLSFQMMIFVSYGTSGFLYSCWFKL